MEIGYHDSNTFSALNPLFEEITELGIKVEYCPLPTQQDQDFPEVYIINPNTNENGEIFFNKIKKAAQTNPKTKFILYMPPNILEREKQEKARKTIGTLPNLEFLFQDGPNRFQELLVEWKKAS